MNEWKKTYLLCFEVLLALAMWATFVELNVTARLQPRGLPLSHVVRVAG
jgi:hypothetical protein